MRQMSPEQESRTLGQVLDSRQSFIITRRSHDAKSFAGFEERSEDVMSVLEDAKSVRKMRRAFGRREEHSLDADASSEDSEGDDQCELQMMSLVNT